MNLSAPTVPVFAISLILAILAVISMFVVLPFVTQYAFWVAIIAYLVLMVGTLARGM